MKNSEFHTPNNQSSDQVLPELDEWRDVAKSFLDRVGEGEIRDELTECLDMKFMSVQAICCGLQQAIRRNSADKMLADLADELSNLLQMMDLKLNHSCFGRYRTSQFSQCDYIGWWCLVMEFATVATVGSTIEFSIGSLAHGVELEIGSDCRELEQAGVLESRAFRFVRRLMPVTRAIDLKCPLGGGAIQLDILGNPPQHQNVA